MFLSYLSCRIRMSVVKRTNNEHVKKSVVPISRGASQALPQRPGTTNLAFHGERLNPLAALAARGSCIWCPLFGPTSLLALFISMYISIDHDLIMILSLFITIRTSWNISTYFMSLRWRRLHPLRSGWAHAETEVSACRRKSSKLSKSSCSMWQI